MASIATGLPQITEKWLCYNALNISNKGKESTAAVSNPDWRHVHNEAITGSGNRHLLDDFAGLFRRHSHTNGGPNHFHWVQYPLVVATFVLVVASVFGMGAEVINVARDPSRLFDQPAKQTTTTTNGNLQTPSTAATQVAQLGGIVGVVGCSNTRQHVEAYHTSSSVDKFWSWQSIDPYSGGSLRVWADGSQRHWSTFETNVAQNPGTDVVWVQLCFRASEASSSGMTALHQSDLTYVINRIKQTLPNAVIVVSPLNGFSGPECPITGPYGQPNSVELADWAASQGLALRGPNTGPLDTSQRAFDLCHLNDAGRAVVGPQMVAYFDDGAPLPDPEPDPDPDPPPPPSSSDCNAVVSMSQGRQVYQGSALGSHGASPLEAATGEHWMLLFQSGKVLSWWTDPSVWSGLGERERCGTDAEIDRVVFIFDPFGSTDVAEDLTAVTGIIKARYPAAEINLTLLVGSDDHSPCQIQNTQGQLQDVRASSTHAARIGQMSMPEAGPDLDIACSGFADRLGHLTDSGAASANQQLADFVQP